MEQVHGVDVSWMTQASPKDKNNKKQSPPSLIPSIPQQTSKTISSAATNPPVLAESQTNTPINGQINDHLGPASTTNAPPTSRRRARSGSLEKGNGGHGIPQRRNSWFSNISAKFSSSSNPAQNYPANQQTRELEQQDVQDPIPPPPSTSHPRVHQPGMPRNAVLAPATRPEGNGPYTPAPPKGSQSGFLGVFRRLSSSSGAALGPGGKLGNGLVERKVLNVDQNRQRCPISELSDAKLRKVSFCVDVEIAPMPKYADGEIETQAAPLETAQKKKLSEKGEGEALKHPKAMEKEKEMHSIPKIPMETTESEPENPGGGSVNPSTNIGETVQVSETGDNTRKKEKKKKSEEERKARKEKKRKLAEANGSIPMEIHYSSDSSSDPPTGNGTPKTTSLPTTNPVRIYRRCCQLRETPILKKITEQLMDPANSSVQSGTVTKLDLTGYYMQFGDLVTLGDYLAVVPVREVILENINLTDEGLRVILAGLLAARPADLRRRKPKHGLEEHRGLVERLVIKNNKLGPDGWKHLSLFVYLCRSLKFLDISHIPFPRQASVQNNGTLPNGQQLPRGIADIFSKALCERLGGPTLELINLGETEPTMDQLGIIIDGIIKSGVKRLGLARNHLDDQGVGHLTRFLASGKCEGLDLGGNDLRDHMEQIISVVKETDPLWALSLSGCNLSPASLGKVLPTMAKLNKLRFIDLSHNHDLFKMEPSAVGILRRYLPKMEPLKRIHLQDVGITAEQTIALVEVLPELRDLAHINILDNTELIKLADARTEEEQEEACALYASLMAAARLSKTLLCVDIEVPSDRSGEIVKAMAKQVVAYCLRNMEHIPENDIGAAVASALNETRTERDDSKEPPYPDVLLHLVGRDVLDEYDDIDGNDTAPDEDYVIGGTGVVKALTCCLKNRGGDESRRQSGDFSRDHEGEPVPAPRLATGGKAKDMSKHLLAGARKIRLRIQPALNNAKATTTDDMNLRKLIFLDDTLKGIIKRFEDEFPDTRQTTSVASPLQSVGAPIDALSSSPPTEEAAVVGSDGEDESRIHPPKALSRTNSSLQSKLQAEEEGRVLRAGHRFRSGFFTTEHLNLLSTIDDIGADPKHQQLLTGMAEDIGGDLFEMVKKKGAVRTFKEDRELVFRCMKEHDPEHWDSFVESQQKARANISVPTNEKSGSADESAIAD